MTRRLAGLIGRVFREFAARRAASSFAEIAMPPVEHWLEPDQLTLDVAVEMPDGRSLSVLHLAGREADAIGPVEAAMTAMAARDARRGGLRLALSTDLVLLVAGQERVPVPMFNPAAMGLHATLAKLAGEGGEDTCVYDNLDQGWALRLDLRGAFLEIVEWDWDAAEAPPRIAWRLSRDRVRAEAARAATQFRQVHAALVKTVGEDWWNPRW